MHGARARTRGQGHEHRHAEPSRRVRHRQSRRGRRRRLASQGGRASRRGQCACSRGRQRAWRHGVRHAGALRAHGPHAALCRRPDPSRRIARGGRDARPEPAGCGRREEARSCRHPFRVRADGRRSEGAEHRVRFAHDARAPLGANEDRREPRRAHGARQRAVAVDHRPGGAQGRARLARARLRRADRHRHGHHG